MKTQHLQPLITLLLIMQPLSSCRSSGTVTTTQTQTTVATSMVTDSMHAHGSHIARSTTAVTFLPAAPDFPLPDLAATLMSQGGGTLIITRETETVSDTATSVQHYASADTNTESHAEQQEPAEARPRASPFIRSLTWLVLSLCLLIVLIKSIPT